MGYFYTVLQFLLLSFILFTPPLLPGSYVAIIVLLIAVLIGLWAIYTFRHTRINIFPYLPEDAKLVFSGPYKYVRHPMYTAVLLFSLSYFIARPGWIYALYFASLLVVLLLKIRFEEKQLKEYFTSYDHIFFKRYRIIPCIY